MCKRFTRLYTWPEVVALYRLTLGTSNLQPRYNICPTTTVDVIVATEGQRELVPMRWGLIPAWWNKPLKAMKLATFNAWAETVADEPMFRSAFKRNRCLILASGYYEWHDAPTGKQPYYFTARDSSPLTVAGLWDEWKNVETGALIKSCTMIITSANAFVSKLHERMPVLLGPQDFDAWLSGDARAELLKPAADDYLQTWPVSRRINSSRAPDDDPTLINEIASEHLDTVRLDRGH